MGSVRLSRGSSKRRMVAAWKKFHLLPQSTFGLEANAASINRMRSAKQADAKPKLKVSVTGGFDLSAYSKKKRSK